MDTVVPPDVVKTDDVSAPSLQSISLPSRPAVASGSAPAQADLPDWLLELAGDGTPAAAEISSPASVANVTSLAPPAQTTEGALPDWLANLAGESAGTSPLQPLSSTTPSSPVATPASTEALPDWLTDLTSDTETFPDFGASEPATSAADTPAWLSAMEGESVDTASSDSNAMPDWLSPRGTPEPAIVDTTVSAPETDLIDTNEDTPAWMSGLFDETTEQTDTPLDGGFGVESTSEPHIVPDTALPAWVTNEPTETDPVAFAPTTSEQGFLSSSPFDEQEPEVDADPDWLYTPDTTEATAPEAQPDWLSGMLSEEADGATEDASLDVDESDVYEIPTSGIGAWDNPPSSDEDDTAAVAWGKSSVDDEAADWQSPAASPITEIEAVAVLPDWLQATADPEQPQIPPRAENLPDWLMQYADDSAASVTPGPAALPDWILATADEDAVPATQPAPVATLEPAATSGDDWMGGLLDDLPPDTPELEPVSLYVEDDIPEAATTASGLEWLQDTPTFKEEKPAESPPEVAALPDWLRDVSGDGIAAEPESEIAPSTDSALPDWLSSAALAEEPPVVAPATTSDTTSESPGGAITGAATRTPTEVFQSELDDAEIPDWLHAAESVATESIQTPMDIAPTELDVGVTIDDRQELTEAVGPPAQTSTEALQSDSDAGAGPDWLRAAASEATVPTRTPTGIFQSELDEGEVPDWLREVEATADTDMGMGAKFEASSVVAGDWLSGLAVEPAAPVAEVAEATSADMPDWLQSLGGDAGTTSAPSSIVAEVSPATTLPDTSVRDVSPVAESTADAPTEMPDWLQELSSSESGDVPMDTGFAAEATMPRADLPGWLQELRPPGTGPLPPLPPELAGFVEGDTPHPAETGNLMRADIPDWVKELRPQVTADGTVIKKVTGPAEAEGPLSGIAGVIMPIASVDIPVNFTARPLPQVPDVIVQQAQLWQQLLEQPHAQARPVSQQHVKPGIGAAIVRILVLLLLLGSGALGVLLDERLAQPPPVVARPGVAQLRDAIETLHPGDTVIIAVEYGFAEAPEMQPLAEALLRHLQARDVQVMAVSTLPEGIVLVDDLLTSLAITNTLPASESVYRAGNYNGVADFLNRKEAWSGDFLLVIAGRADRVRWWVEQNATFSATLPMGLVLNASAGNYVTPYSESQHVAGWMVGLADMLTYRQLLHGEEFDKLGDMDFGRIFNALLLTHWMAIALLFFGLLYAWIAGKKRTR